MGTAEQRGRTRDLRVFPELSLVRLKVLFLLLGTLVVSVVLVLSVLMSNKLESAASDREEMVALRVFDELEREVSAFLEGENSRAPYVHLEQTNPETWAPFVVGYFKVEAGQVEAVAADGATSENKRRMKWAVAQLRDRRVVSGQAEGQEQAEALGDASPHPPDSPQLKTAPEPDAEGVAKSPHLKKGKAPGSKIIESLNRAPERRKQSPGVKPAPRKSKIDQFSDYARAF